MQLKSAEGKKRVLGLTNFRIALFTILHTYNWIWCILDRIDDDLSNGLQYFGTLREAEQGARVSVNELPPFNSLLINVDIVSLIVFLNILMDDIARFVRFFFKGESIPQTSSFYDLKKTMKDFKGQRLQELNRIIQDTNWFKRLKNLRDNPIVHKGIRDSETVLHGEKIGIHLYYRKNRTTKGELISNLEIDSICENVYGFLKDLNEFLCNNFEDLPLEVSRLTK